MNILLVEDDAILRKSLVFFLSSKNYNITAFDNGKDAIDRINSDSEKPDLVITDLNLPSAGGQQIINVIRNLEDSEIPIIVLTANRLESTELDVLDLGANEFMSKPFSPKVLLKRIEKLLS